MASLLSTDEIQMNGAFANINLIASKVWASGTEDKYRKLNQSLWLQNCKLSETYNGKNAKRPRVRDIIPASRLAQYGNYEYNEEREKMYNYEVFNDDAWNFAISHENEKKELWRDVEDMSDSQMEPWSLKQVEDCFVRLISMPTSPLLAGKNQRLYDDDDDDDDDNGKYTAIRYTIEDVNELQLQSRITSKIVKDLWASRRVDESTCREQQRSSLTNYYKTRFLNDEAAAAASQDDKNNKIRRYCVEKKKTEIRKTYQQNSYALRNDRNYNAKRSSFFYPVSTNSTVTNRPIVPILCPEVAEFFPKAPHAISSDEERQSVQYFPSSAEPSYKEELFPYNQPHFSTSSNFNHNTSGLAIAVSNPTSINTWIRGPAQWIHRIGPPIQIQVPNCAAMNNPPMYSTMQPFCPTLVQRPLNFHEKILSAPVGNSSGAIPVYQRPAELYQETPRGRMKNSQGVDFNNLILLTKNAMKARRNQSKNPQQASSFILESRQPNLKSETDVLQWLNRGYPKRAREFGRVNSLVSELARFEGKCDIARAGPSTGEEREEDEDEEAQDKVREDEAEGIMDESLQGLNLTKKRLYRDVLTNTASSEIVIETLLDKRYDELEQQAMEQYRTSEECLAIRYQELERQGLEQYTYGDSSSESIKALRAKTFGSERELRELEYKDKGNKDESFIYGRHYSAETFEKPRYFNATHSNEDFRSNHPDKAGPAIQRPVTIPRSHFKCEPLYCNLPQHGSFQYSRDKSNTDQNSNLRDENICTLNQTALKLESNGASGDKIEQRVETTAGNKGHVILVSRVKKTVPLTRSRFGAREMTSDCRKVVSKSVEIVNGGGDEKVTILRSSPRAQVWLSSLWG